MSYSLVKETKFPLTDGQVVERVTGQKERIMGNIVIRRGNTPETTTYDPAVCWSLQGNWYRRSDGEPMTGVGGAIPVKEFFRLQRKGRYDDRHASKS